MDLMELYRSVLKTAGVSVDADGYCWRYSDDKSEKLPFVMKKKQVILPYRESLQEPDNENTVFFHPLNQSAARGPSDILDVYRASVMREINVQIALVFVGMADMVVSTDRHKELTSYELDLITPLKAFDEKMLATLRQVIKAVPTNSNNESYASAFVKKGGTKDGRKYKFLTKVSWPVFEELLESKSCGGVSLKTKKAEAAFAALFAVLGVTEDEMDSYSVGSDSSTAPAFECLLASVKRLVTRLNEIVDNSPNIFTGIESIPFGWGEEIEDMQQFAVEIKKIPILNGNIGSVVGEEPAPPARREEAPRREESPSLDEVRRDDRRDDRQEARMSTEERRRASGFNPTPPPNSPSSAGASLAERAEAQKRKIEEQNRRMIEEAQRRRQAREDDDARYYGSERQLGRGRDDYYDDRRDSRRDERRDYRDDRDRDRDRGRRDYNNPFLDRVEDDERAQRGGDRDRRGGFGQGFSSGRGGRGRGGFGV